jgi:D-glycero-D-manno-heptose 1,7-bisphosphate phosphatase
MTATLRQAVVLAGGRATRLGTLAAATPKPLLPVGGRPFLFWLLRELSRFGVEEAVLLTGHLAERMEEAVPALVAALPKPMRITLSREPAPAGTGGALWHARGQLDARFLLVNGDSLLDANLARLLADAAGDGPDVLGRLACFETEATGRAGVVATEGGTVTAFHDRPEVAGRSLINAGICALRREIVEHLRPDCSLERDVLPALAARGVLRATKLAGWFIDIGVPEDLARAQAGLHLRLQRPALFLDRDGVLNHDHGYVGHRERFAWTEDAPPAVRAASEAGWHVFVVTNQSGVARGYYDEAAVAALHGWMADELRRAGGTVDDLRYCPCHPEAAVPAYRRESDWRKPAPGMILDLIRAWQLDPARCVLIGDQETDMAAAAAAGIEARRFAGGSLLAAVAPYLQRPDWQIRRVNNG